MRHKTQKNSVSITNIYIKNFRSIGEADIDAKQMNIFVGLNDAGKSNVLKALDWFFNKSHDQEYNNSTFKENYSFYNDRKTNKAYEIIIRLTLFLPGFNCNVVRWEKVWRRDEVREKFTDQNGKEITQGNFRVRTAARRLKYKYVPAVKGRTVFAELLRDLYFTLSGDDNNEMLKNAQKFSNSIVAYTANVSKDIKQNLDLESKIVVPENMAGIFSSLKFETYDKEQKIPLEHRGDGIQARHIPPLLKFISEHDIKNNHRGKVSSNIVWGYEEPENGVELAQCFKMAHEFLELANDFQMFITTHSPAFYSIGNEHGDTVQTHFVKKEHDAGSRFVPNDFNIDESMGLMPVIAPYIRQKEIELSEEKNRLQKIIKENDKLHFPSKVLIVEDSDKRVVDLWKYLLSDNSITVLAGGGCTNKTQEHWIDVQKQLKPDYDPKVLKVIDRDGYTAHQLDFLNTQKVGYKQIFLPVYEIENFAVIDNENFTNELFTQNAENLVQSFYATALPNLRKLDLQFDTIPDSKGLFAINRESAPIAKSMWKEAKRDWRHFVNGKELCKLIPNFNWIDHIREHQPDKLCDLIIYIKNFFNR